MHTFDNTVTIARPAGEGFAFLADFSALGDDGKAAAA